MRGNSVKEPPRAGFLPAHRSIRRRPRQRRRHAYWNVAINVSVTANATPN